MIDNKAFNLYLNDIKDIKVLSVEEEKYLFKNFNPENRKKIIESNLKLVVALSREYYNIPFESLTYMDIIEAGNIGLIKAVERFDYKKGYKFSTFASYYIKSQIIKEIYKNNRIIRRPFNQERLISKKLKTIQTVLSLDDSFPNSIDGTEPLLYFIEDEENNIYDKINQIEIKEIIKDILNTLTPRQKEVLLLRFGFDDGNYKTLRKVGSILKISDEGVRKIEQKAFTKIRKNNNLKDIKVLSIEEEKYLFENFNPENRKKIIESNLKLVVALSKDYLNLPFESLTYMDIIEAGNIGLIKAVERFDYKKGYKFSTFASYYIKSYIVFEIYTKDRMIKRPYYYEYKRIKEVKENKKEKIEKVYSLDQSVLDETTENSESLLYFIKDDNVDIENEIENKDLKIIIKDILNKLTPREREIIKLRHGLDNLDEKTFEEIGKIFGITRQRANQIANDVYKRIRKGKNIEDYL